MLAKWQLGLPGFDFDIIHRTGIKKQIAYAIPGLAAEGEDSTNIDDDPPVQSVDLNKDRTERIEVSPYIACHICDQKV